MYITTKENVEDLLSTTSMIRKPMNEELKILSTQLIVVQEVLNKMDTDNISYTFEQYLDVVDEEENLQRQILKLVTTKDIKW